MRFITPCICISFILFSGCQSIKKPSESTKVLEQGIPSGQSDISSRPVTDTTEEKQQPLSGEGLATISDFKSALESGDVPLQRIPADIDFLPATQIDDSAKEIFENIYFSFDSYQVEEKYQDVLKKIASYLKQHPEVHVLIEGHCDERGTREYNLVLGEQRALAIRRILIILGISPERIHTVSYGFSKPADPEHNEQAWAKNRRCEFKLGVKKTSE